MRPLEYAIDARIPESQVRIREIADEMILLTRLLMVLEALQLPQNTVAKTMGISQPL